MDAAIIKLDAAQTALAECRTVMEAKQIADVAEAARIYLERTNASVETVNRAAEIRTLAERQMGHFLKTMPKNEGAKGTGSNQHEVRSREGTAPATLAQIGITKKQSATAQKLASIPENELHERIAVAKASGEAPTPARVLSFGAPPQKNERFTMPARGQFIARGAVNQLETILATDRERAAALTYVRDWCDKELKKQKAS